MNILFALLQKRIFWASLSPLVQGHPLSYVFDNSQGGISIRMNGTEEMIVRSRLDLPVCSVHVQWFGSRAETEMTHIDSLVCK